MFELLAPALLAVMLFLLGRELTKGSDLSGIAFAVAGDEDMKIADGSFSLAYDDEASDSDAAAQAYLNQKSVGNIEKARTLGHDLARALSREAEKSTASKLCTHHRLVLFSYVVNRVIADLSPNSILAQTVLNVFYDQVEEHSSDIAGEIRDMAAYSLYILCERSEARTEDAIGSVYAKLCGEEDNLELAEEGNGLYHDYYELCSHMHWKTDYVKAQ